MGLNIKYLASKCAELNSLQTYMYCTVWKKKKFLLIEMIYCQKPVEQPDPY